MPEQALALDDERDMVSYAHPRSPAHLNAHDATQTVCTVWVVHVQHTWRTPCHHTPAAKTTLLSVAHEQSSEPIWLMCGGSYQRECDVWHLTHTGSVPCTTATSQSGTLACWCFTTLHMVLAIGMGDIVPPCMHGCCREGACLYYPTNGYADRGFYQYMMPFDRKWFCLFGMLQTKTAISTRENWTVKRQQKVKSCYIFR